MDMHGQQLQSLAIQQFPMFELVTELSLANNLLEEFPECLGQMRNMTFLSMNNNRLREVVRFSRFRMGQDDD